MAGNVTEAARLLARVGADTSEFESKMRGASTTVNQTSKNLGDGLSGGARTALGGITQLMGGTGSLIAQLLQAGGAAGAAVVAFKAIQQAVKSGVELQDYAQQVNLVADAYERFAGVSVAEGAPELREATQGVMSDMDAAQMSMKLMAMHLADSNEEAAKLLSLATKLTQLSGGDISGLLPLLTNQSALRLDEFLVSGDATKKLQDQYVAAGMDSGAAFMKAFMEEAQKTVDKAGAIEVPVAQREAATNENYKAAKAESFNTSWLGGVFSGIRENQVENKQLAADWHRAFVTIREYRQEVERLHEQGYLSGTDKQDLDAILSYWNTLNSIGIPALTDEIQQMSEQSLALNEALGDARAAQAQANAQKELQDEFSASAAQAEHLQYVLDGLRDKQVEIKLNITYQEKLAGQRVDAATTARYAGLAEEYALNPENYGSPARDDEGWYGGGRTGTSLSNAQQTARIMDDVKAAWEADASEREAAAREAQSEAESQAQKWESFVSGLLQPTTVTDADMAATEMGVYKDKWDEPVRQFRMAEKGHNAYEISEYERKFYSGQLLDEVNWGSKEEGTGLIGAAMQAQEEERGQENLLNTAMQKLSEAGIGLDREQVSNLLGLPTDYESVGAERAQNLETGLTQADIGTALADSFNAQIKAEASRWIVFGETMGDWLVEGLENTAVGGEFIDAVVALVLPRVQEALAGNSMP